MSSHAAPDAGAFEELERLVRALGEELSRFRKRAHAAEARLKELERAGDSGTGPVAGARVIDLERENAALRRRLDTAADRTRAALDRVRFLRQQQGEEAR
jgi:predicted  nucleic acid-binding Zn-ribbon protein